MSSIRVDKLYLCEIITFEIAPSNIEITFDFFCN